MKRDRYSRTKDKRDLNKRIEECSPQVKFYMVSWFYYLDDVGWFCESEKQYWLEDKDKVMNMIGTHNTIIEAIYEDGVVEEVYSGMNGRSWN